jgi:hypothetical protein
MVTQQVVGRERGWGEEHQQQQRVVVEVVMGPVLLPMALQVPALQHPTLLYLHRAALMQQYTSQSCPCLMGCLMTHLQHPCP